jgi:hypothetical protein
VLAKRPCPLLPERGVSDLWLLQWSPRLRIG